MILKEKIKKNYDRCAPIYDTDTPFQKHMACMLVEAMVKDGVRFSSVLDVGCGTGYLVEKMGTHPIYGIFCKNEMCPHFFLCDISLGMLHCARSKLHILSNTHFVQSDAQRLPFNANSFNIVASNAVYQWVQDLSKAFGEVRRALTADGKFYFTIFNKNTLWQLQDIFKQIDIAAPISVNFITKDILLSALRETGFNIVEIQVLKYERYYKDLWELLVSLKRIGGAITEYKGVSGLGWRPILCKADELYAQRFGNEKGIPATYEAFLVKAKI